MRWAALALVLLCGCSPLAAYSIGAWPYGKELFGKDEVAEAYARLADRERVRAGYPVQRRGIFPCRNKVPCDWHPKQQKGDDPD